MFSKSFKQKLRYRFDNLFSLGGWAIFFSLITIYIAALLIMASIRVGANLIIEGSFDNAGSHLWTSWLQLMDIGSMAQDTASPVTNRIIGVVTSLLGLALISIMLAFLTSMFKEKLEALRKGTSAVLEKDHTLILGFNIRALEIIKELIDANESEPDAAVVVLSETPKEEMDDFFRDALPHRGTTRVITRSGSISSPLFLKRMCVGQAKSVIMLNPAQPADGPDFKAARTGRSADGRCAGGLSRSIRPASCPEHRYAPGRRAFYGAAARPAACDAPCSSSR